jgi:hypothetical protein
MATYFSFHVGKILDEAKEGAPRSSPHTSCRNRCGRTTCVFFPLSGDVKSLPGPGKQETSMLACFPVPVDGFHSLLKRADQAKQLFSFAGLVNKGDELQHQFIQAARQKRFQTVAHRCLIATNHQCPC